MATPEQLEKKRSRQIEEILEALGVQSKIMDSMVTEIVALKTEMVDMATEIVALKTEMVDLKAEKLGTVELTAEIAEMPDRTDEILIAIADLKNALPAKPAVQMPRKSKK